MKPRLIDIIKAFEQRGRDEDAEYWRTTIPFELGVMHRLSEKAVMMMTMDEIEGWYQKPMTPLKYEGWNFWWGTAIDVNYRERNT